MGKKGITCWLPEWICLRDVQNSVTIKQSTCNLLLASRCVCDIHVHIHYTHTQTPLPISHLYSFSSILNKLKKWHKSTFHACNGQVPLVLPLSTVLPPLSHLCHPWPFLPVLAHLTKIWRPFSKSKDFLKHILGVQTPQKLQCTPPQTQKKKVQLPHKVFMIPSIPQPHSPPLLPQLPQHSICLLKA